MGLDTYNGLIISLIDGRRGFGSKDDLWEIICPESYGGGHI